MDDDIIARILRAEGGFVDHPSDRGGPTNFGITAKTLGHWRKLGRPATASEVFHLSQDEAEKIYQQMYIKGPKFDQIADPKLRFVVIDAGVNSGPLEATRWLQRALNIQDDGIFGKQTAVAVNAADPKKTAFLFMCERLLFIGRLITRRPSQAAFAAGWMSRIVAEMKNTTTI